MNKISFSSSIVTSTGGVVKSPDKYVELKNAYSEFICNVDKSDFANSPNRYIVEMRAVEELERVALESGQKEDALTWVNRKQEIIAKLKEWGIELNN